MLAKALGLPAAAKPGWVWPNAKLEGLSERPGRLVGCEGGGARKGSPVKGREKGSGAVEAPEKRFSEKGMEKGSAREGAENGSPAAEGKGANGSPGWWPRPDLLPFERFRFSWLLLPKTMTAEA